MIQDKNRPGEHDLLALVAGDGEMGRLIRAFDWSKTPVGPLVDWPQSLRVAVRIMTDSRYAMWLGWGPDFTFFYNEAYARMTLGPKHPWALGRSAREVWSEIWDDIGPRAESVIRTGQATWDEGLLLFLERKGLPEETYHTFSYSPIPDDWGRVGGMLCVVTEDTERTIGERRLRTLRELAARTSEAAMSVEDACQTATRTLAENRHDLPFVLIYLLDEDSKTAKLCGITGLPDGSPAALAIIDLAVGVRNKETWPLRAVLESGHAEVVTGLGERFGLLRCGPWPEPIQQAVVVPITKPGQHSPAGFVVAGVSPRLEFSDKYKGFLELIGSHVASAVSNARAYEEERRRAEQLAELDRAKTAFFSNVSHEFRTPLTLMLGPVADLLARSHTDLPPAAAGQLEVVNRNGLRLMRLVNSLLDFSRIEAGRVRAVYQPTDLSTFTADLASNFRSACERAGLRLTVDCPPLGELVFVDRDMWEKIVLNLLSNAFKFTFEGEIDVSLRRAETVAELKVKDTGTGIPAEQMPRLFERFHRIENARGRTHEGSGIGLALVQELVNLHGGAVTADSVMSVGTTFTVRIPLGSAHLPPDQIGVDRTSPASGTGASPYVEEALRWLPDESGEESRTELPTYQESLPTPYRRLDSIGEDNRPRVLVADDNADMRQYIFRLLTEQFRVEAVTDGEAALAVLRERPPDLILTDVMMPKLNGFGLLKELRADPRTCSIPVIILSARAGEESRVEGMEAGADDYLVKPFSARELLARVSAHLQMARLRRESDRRWRDLAEALPNLVWTALPDGRGDYFSYQCTIFTGVPEAELLGNAWLERVIHPDDRQRTLACWKAALEEKGSYDIVYRLRRHDGEYRWFKTRGVPVRDDQGRVVKWFGTCTDIEDLKQIQEALAKSEERFRTLFESMEEGFCVIEMLYDAENRPYDYRFLEANPTFEKHTGIKDAVGRTIRELVPNHDTHWYEIYGRVAATGEATRFVNETKAIGRWFDVYAYRVGGPDSRKVGILFTDITTRKRNDDDLRQMATALAEADHRKNEFLATLAHELRNPLAPIRNCLQLMRMATDKQEAVEQARIIMERQLKQLVRLVDDLLDMSRISQGKMELRRERIHLSVVLNSAVESSSPLIEEMGHQLTVTLPGEEVVLDADFTRLAQVFLNLLNNSAKYTDRGGHIWLTAERQGSDVVVSVKDDGIGIDVGQLPRLFEMFSQLDHALERSQGGLGIGLTLVRRLVEMHGGRIEARSEGLGKGSEFVVRLPVVVEASRPSASIRDESAALNSSLRILVVDDNRDGADSLAMMLNAMGNETHTAYDGEEAVEAAVGLRPDVILLDIGLPKLTGYEVCRRIREKPLGKKFVIIAQTGWGQEDDRKRAREAGFDHHMVKPVDPQALMKLLAGLQATKV